MATTIFKYKCPEPGHAGTILMPKGATVVHVDDGHFWALVDEDAEQEDRIFITMGTGWVVPDGGEYLGTWWSLPTRLVWHLTELLAESTR